MSIVHFCVRLRPKVAESLARCNISILPLDLAKFLLDRHLKHGPIVALRVLQLIGELGRFPPLLDLIELIFERLFDFAIDQRLDL